MRTVEWEIERARERKKIESWWRILINKRNMRAQQRNKVNKTKQTNMLKRMTAEATAARIFKIDSLLLLLFCILEWFARPNQNVHLLFTFLRLALTILASRYKINNSNCCTHWIFIVQITDFVFSTFFSSSIFSLFCPFDSFDPRFKLHNFASFRSGFSRPTLVVWPTPHSIFFPLYECAAVKCFG